MNGSGQADGARREPAGLSVGLFSTLTGETSRALVKGIAAACRDGTVPAASVAFLLVNRAHGESDVTDESVRQVESEFRFPVVRASAVAFRREQRKAARVAAAAGDQQPLESWRDAFYESYEHRLPVTDLDVLVGDMWIWGPLQCARRVGVNLHPALPDGPAGVMWYDAIWDLVLAGASESGVMIHRVTTAVDLGPVVAYCRYPLRSERLDPLWALLPSDPAGLDRLVAEERVKKRESRHELFLALRDEGAKREEPLLVETMRAMAQGTLALSGAASAAGAVDLTAQVEAALEARRA